MLTGISFLKCDICGDSIMSAATLGLHPYNDYRCVSCDLNKLLCDVCGAKKCPECGSTLESTHTHLSKKHGGNILF